MPGSPRSIGLCARLTIARTPSAPRECATSTTNASGGTVTLTSSRRFSATHSMNAGLREVRKNVGYGGGVSTGTGMGFFTRAVKTTWPTAFCTNSSKEKSQTDWCLTTSAAPPNALIRTTSNRLPTAPTPCVASTRTFFEIPVEMVFMTSRSRMPSTPTVTDSDHATNAFVKTGVVPTSSAEDLANQRRSESW